MKNLNLSLLTLLALAACQTAAPNDTPRGRQTTDDFALGANRRPSAATLHSMSRILASQGRDAECEVVLQRLITDYPKFAPGYNELAEVYLRNQELDSAMATLRIGLEELPDDAVLLNNVGLCLILDGDYDAALEWFQAAAEARPSHARMLANLALALGMVGREDESRALYEQVLGPLFAEHNLAVVRAARAGSDPAARQEALGDLKGSPTATAQAKPTPTPTPTPTPAPARAEARAEPPVVAAPAEPEPELEPLPTATPSAPAPEARLAVESAETPRPRPTASGGREFVAEEWRGVARQDLTATRALVVEKNDAVEVRVYADGRRQVSLASAAGAPTWVFAADGDHLLSPGASAAFDAAGALSRSFGKVETFSTPAGRPAWEALAQ